MKRSSQAGSAFFLILIGIALFAALSYAFLQGSRTATSELGKDQARLVANEIISYAASLQKAVDTLRLRGCLDTELNFTHPLDVGNLLVNPNSPSDKSCDLFDMNGGKLSFSGIDIKALDTAYASQVALGYGLAVPTGDIANEGVGSAQNDLAIVAPFVKKEVCTMINNIVGITNPNDSPPVSTVDLNYSPFAGTYNSGTGGLAGVNNTAKGKSIGCIEASNWGPDVYFFFAMLVAR